MDGPLRWPRGLLLFCLACCLALGLRSWWLGRADDGGGVGIGQFMWLLLATPSLMTVAGVAEVLRRLARARAGAATGNQAPLPADPAYNGLLASFVIALVLLWVQLWLQRGG